MGVYSKYKNVNTTFGGTSGIVLPSGTTAERSASVVVGTMRYNTDLGLVEQYNALGWQSVDAPPTISNFSGVINENTTTTLTVTGSNLKSGVILYVTGAAVNNIDRALSTTWVSGSTVTASTNATSVNFTGGAAYGLKVVNPSGLSGILDPAGNIDRDPLWNTASGTTTIYDAQRGNSVTYSASDPDGNAITYSIVTGSLPTGASLNTSTGVVSGFSAVGSDTSSTFTLRATSTSSVGSLVSTADRSFTILVKAPIVQTYTSVTTTTWTAPFTGNIQVLVVGGGGAGGGGTAAGGGAGGLLYSSAYPVSSGSGYTVTVGGGQGARGNNGGGGGTGGNSVFGSYTSYGGGGGGGYPGGASSSGGSGGGGCQYPGWGSTGASNGTAGQGNAGGYGPNGGGGGGGAGGAGAANQAGAGGVGLQYSISGSNVYYAGGGGGSNAGSYGGPGGAGGGGGGSGNSNSGGSPGSGLGSSGWNASYYGGGGGGGWDYGSGGGGGGYQGIVILRY